MTRERGRLVKKLPDQVHDHRHVRSPQFGLFRCALVCEKDSNGNDSWVVTCWEMNRLSREEVHRDRDWHQEGFYNNV